MDQEELFRRLAVALAGLLKGELLAALLWPVLAAVSVFLLAVAVLSISKRGSPDAPKLQIKSPFDLGTVLWLAALIAGITLLAKLLAGSIGDAGLFMLAAVSGIADADALTLSMARLAGEQVPADSAAKAILIAAAVNTVSKAAIAAFVGGARLGRTVGVVSALGIGAPALTSWLMR